MKPSQLRKTETIKYGDIFSGKNGLIMKLRKLSCFVPGCSWKICASTMSRSSL
ncbi:unnamed protein product [Brassica rapa]|uniref:Uncharacterized protein n=2 Tax=Brassica TaxID=3705 RepID=A0A3P6AQF1_BRACM|nr:unnamed protein product [Brassica napus]CAG7901014.1 unnamed protein product [Brassica rapa]VDC96126.1 unnamed protein product [Brassica rapa]